MWIVDSTFCDFESLGNVLDFVVKEINCTLVLRTRVTYYVGTTVSYLQEHSDVA